MPVLGSRLELPKTSALKQRHINECDQFFAEHKLITLVTYPYDSCRKDSEFASPELGRQFQQLGGKFGSMYWQLVVRNVRQRNQQPSVETVSYLINYVIHAELLSNQSVAEIYARTRWCRNLASTNLKGPIPSAIGELAYLENLNLTNNSVSDPIPQEIGKLVHLQVLVLNSNNFTKPPPEALLYCNLTRL